MALMFLYHLQVLTSQVKTTMSVSEGKENKQEAQYAQKEGVLVFVIFGFIKNFL